MSKKTATRVWVTSLISGCLVSAFITALVSLTGTAYYFPPFWPGLWFSWVIVIVAHGEQWTDTLLLVLSMIGNAAVYACLTFLVLRAEIRARGRLSRYFLQ
jgi:hypothetical protein